MLVFHENGTASCCNSLAGCSWHGVPTFTGGRLVRPPRWIRTPTGRMEQLPGKREGSVPDPRCPACGLDAEYAEIERELAPRRLVAPPRAKPKVARNAPCPCGSGLKSKKCCAA